MKYANRAKNIKMKVEANKKMVHLHISAYKNIISDLRDEIDQLKAQLSHDIGAGGSNKHFAPSKTQQAAEFRKYYQIEAKRIMEEENKKLRGDMNPQCNCESRKKDEVEKKKIQQEIERTYEEIIQQEQALIELDEQNTLNAMEIRKRDAKVFLFGQQIQDNEEELNDKENSQDHQKIKDNQVQLNKQITQQRD